MPNIMAYSVTWTAFILFFVILQSNQERNIIRKSNWNTNVNYNQNNLGSAPRAGINNIIIRKPIIRYVYSETLVPWREYFYTSGEFEFFRDLKINPNSPLYLTLKTIEAYTGKTMTDLYNRFYKLFFAWKAIRNKIIQQNDILSTPHALRTILTILFPKLQFNFEMYSDISDWRKMYTNILNVIFPHWLHDKMELLLSNADSPEDLVKEVLHQIISLHIDFPVSETETLAEVCKRAFKLLFTHLPNELYQVFDWQNMLETFEKFLAYIYEGTPNLFSSQSDDLNPQINSDIFNLLVKFVDGLKVGEADIPEDLIMYFVIHPHLKFYVKNLFRTKEQADELINEENIIQVIQYIMDSNIYNIPDSKIPTQVKILLKYIREQPSDILIEKGFITSDVFLSFVSVMKDIQEHKFMWNNVPKNLIEFFVKQRNMKEIIILLLQSPSVTKYTKEIDFNVVYSLFDLLVHNSVTNLTQETLQFIITLPNNENIFSSTIYSNIPPVILLELIHFIKVVEDNNVVQQNISQDLLKFILKMPNFNETLEQIYTSKLATPLKLNVRIDLLEKFILFLAKHEQKSSTLSDLTPDILEIIVKQPDPNELIPNLPDGLNSRLLLEIINFLNDIESHRLNWETIPTDLIQYFQTATNLENTFQILFKSPVTSNLHLNPNTVTKFVFYLEKRSTQQLSSSDLSQDVLQLILKFNNSQELLPFEIDQSINSSIITQIMEFISNVHTKQVDIKALPDELLIFFEKYPNLDVLLKQILKSQLFSSKNIDANILIQFSKNLNKIKNNSLTSLDMSQELLQFTLSFPKLQPTITNLVFDQNISSSVVSLLIKFLTEVETKQVDIKNIPPSLIEFFSTCKNLNQTIEKIIGSPLISYHNVPTNIVLQLIDMINNHRSYNRISLSNISIELLEYLSELSTNFLIEGATPKQLVLLIEFINKVNSKTQNLMKIPNDLSKFFLECSNLQQLIVELYNTPYILKSTSSSTMIILINLLIDLKTHTTIQMQITTELQELLEELPDGRIILSKIKPIPSSTTVSSPRRSAELSFEKTPQIITEELYKFIINVGNNQISDISPELLQFILLHSDLENIIREIIITKHITNSNINPDLIVQLLFFIKDTKMQSTINTVPESLIKVLVTMDGGYKLTKIALDWFSEHEQDKMMQLFLQIIKQNGGKEIPEQLKAWILTLSNAQEILDFLEEPGDIECTQTSSNVLSCTKTNTRIISYSSSIGNYEEIIPELSDFVNNISKHKVDIDNIPPHLLNFILTTPDLEQVLLKLLNTYGQFQTSIEIQELIEFIVIVKMYLNGEQINNIPENVLDLILLQGSSDKLVNMALNWKLKQSKGQSSNMFQLFLKLIKETGGKYLPQNVQNWIKTLPNGERILQILQIPGEIKCTDEKDKVVCVKETEHKIDNSLEIQYIS